MLFRGTVWTPLRDNLCSVETFAHSQTNVCLNANDCLAIGKHTKEAPLPLKEYHILPKRMPKVPGIEHESRQKLIHHG
jgi:hypothetical protein